MSLVAISAHTFRRTGSVAIILGNEAVRLVLRMLTLHGPRFLVLLVTMLIPVRSFLANQQPRSAAMLVARLG